MDTTRTSAEFIDSLDRDVLGSFAMRRDVLFYADLAQMRYINMLRHGVTGYGSTDDQDKLDELCEVAGVEHHDALAELFFWWKRTGDKDLIGYIESGNENDKVKDRMAQLEIVAANREMQSFFAVDIWDTELIMRFLNDGVDAEVARELVSAR